VIHAVLSAVPPLARDSDFQAAWYYSVVLAAAILVTGFGFWWALRPLASMWRRGDRGMAATIAAAVGIAFLAFAAMLVTVAISMLPQAYNGGG
jgi:hypothetical protein